MMIITKQLFMLCIVIETGKQKNKVNNQKQSKPNLKLDELNCIPYQQQQPKHGIGVERITMMQQTPIWSGPQQMERPHNK